MIYKTLKMPNKLSWVSRTVDISTVTAPRYSLIFQPSLDKPYVIQRAYVRFVSNTNTPSDFTQIKFKLSATQLNYENPQETIDITAVSNPGLIDLDGAQPFTAIRPREFFYRSPKINWTVLSQNTIAFYIENFLGTGKPNEINLLLTGFKIGGK